MYALPPLHCWVIGDSTVSQFHDNYYVPRAGYGIALDQYLHATIHNLAHSGASSKSFTQLPEYQKFIHACHTAQDDTQSNYILIIGFGHNDEKLIQNAIPDPMHHFQIPAPLAIASQRTISNQLWQAECASLFVPR